MPSTRFHGSIPHDALFTLGTYAPRRLLALSKPSDPVTRPHVLVADRERSTGSNDGVPTLVNWDPDSTTANVADRMDDRHLSGETGDHRGAYAAGVVHVVPQKEGARAVSAPSKRSRPQLARRPMK